MTEDPKKVGVGPTDPDKVLLTNELLEELRTGNADEQGRFVSPRSVARWLVRDQKDGTARLVVM